MFILSPDLAVELERRRQVRQRHAVALASPEPPDSPDDLILEAPEIQGNILPGFTMKRQLLVGLRIVPVQLAEARRWLSTLLEKITTMEEMSGYRGLRREVRIMRVDGDRLPAVALNMAISMPGLRLLTPDADQIQDEAFKGGLGSGCRGLPELLRFTSGQIFDRPGTCGYVSGSARRVARGPGGRTLAKWSAGDAQPRARPPEPVTGPVGDEPFWVSRPIE